MATGKELARMMTCGIWKDNIESRKDFCNAQIYNNKGKPITTDKAQNETHCHARILFKQCPEESLQLIAVLLRTVASTNSEQMVQNTFNFYGFQEIIIS